MTKFTVIPNENNVLVKAWVDGVMFEEQARDQVLNATKLPFVKQVAIMPDVHAGIGSTVGSVIATKGAIIPAIVGVDIGCGMMALRLPLKADDLPDNLFGVRSAIEKNVPHGRTNNGQTGDRGAWNDIPDLVSNSFADTLLEEYFIICQKYPRIDHPKALNHLGTLGTGNHFIEICIDESKDVWVMLHSGSRGVGNSIGSFFINKAKEEMERWFVNLPDKNLAYLPEGSEYFKDYIRAMEWAQKYAYTNREIMMINTLRALKEEFPQISINLNDYPLRINCHHNYLTYEHHCKENLLVSRKGAVSARFGQLGIIPGSMGAKSFIVRGKGSEDSLTSCSHGAGRKMSRTAAQKTFTIEDHKLATKGVECRKDADVIDETPMAYKDIDKVMEAQSDLVDIVHTLKQVVCVKG